MKRNFILACIFASLSISSYAQGEMDAFNLSYNDLKGTARSVGMGGAFGALGGDISGIAINPAGIGSYKSSEIVTTLNLSNANAKTSINGNTTKDSKFKANFDNLGFVGVFPIDSDVAPYINFGFTYNRLKSFDRKISMNGYEASSSLADYIANRVNGYKEGQGIPESSLYTNASPFTKDSEHWLGALGYQGYLIDPIVKGGNKYRSSISQLGNPSLDNHLHIREKGYIDSYDFNVGTTFSDIFSLGVTVSVTDIRYTLYSSYTEEWYSGSDYQGGYDFNNYLRTEGSGWQVKAGFILKPVKELRIGAAYHSPTWYNLTDYYSASIGSDLFGNDVYIDSFEEVGATTYSDYKFRTPDKWVFSLAGIIGKYAVISADYELTNYKNMHLKDDYGTPFSNENTYIKRDFKNSSTVRIGAEIRATPQLSFRAGYMWQQSPVKKSLVNGSKDGSYTAATAGTVTHYSLVGDANYITYGLGYEFSPSLYADIAFVMKSRKDDLYSYGGSDRIELKNNTFSGLLTIGYRFGAK